MINPPRLRQGDTVGVVSPSWGGAALFPHRVERGVRHLEALGFGVKIAPHALNTIGYVSDAPEHRVADLHALFRDPEVRAIVATIGGDHSCHLLPLLDFELLRAHPTVLVGFSDVTVLNVAIWRMTGLTTFNGPMLMTEFAEYPRMPAYSECYLLKALREPEPVGEVAPSDWWTDEFLDWETRADLARERARQPATGWAWLKAGNGGGAEGHLVGGCLESLQHLRGTPYWPDEEQWRGALLFVETSEEKPAPETVDGILMDYQNMGVFDRIAGLLVARPYGYGPDERRALHEVLLERTRRYDFPVVADMDFGHTTPIFTLPLGCRATVDTARRRFAIIEPAVR